MATRVHELAAVISANIAEFNRGINSAIRKTGELRQAWNRAASDVNASATRITAAVTAVGVASARSFAKYEQVIIRAQAVTRTLDTEAGKSLQSLARTMGETTVFSATQAAEAIEQMGLAGLSVREIYDALPGALNLAAAAQVDIATAADISAKTMRAFGADAAELTRINDVMVGTFTRANTDIRQLGEAMKPVAPVSRALGVSLEDTAAIIAKLSDAGFQGSLAGTSLRNIMSRLAGAQPEVTKRLAELGVTTQDAAGNMLPLLDVLQQIERAGLKDAEVLQLFGARGGPQLLALLEVGTAEIRRFSGELRSLQGISEEMANANLVSLSGQFSLVLSKLNELAIAAGERLKPELVGLFSTLIKWMDENKSALVSLATEGFTGLVRFMQQALVEGRELVPMFLEISRAAGEMLRPLLQFLAEHPRLVQALVLLRVSALFGVTQAIGSLTTAITTLLTTAIRPLTVAIGTRLVAAVRAFGGYLVTTLIPNLIALVGVTKDAAIALGATGTLSLGGALLATLAVAGIVINSIIQLRNELAALDQQAQDFADNQESLRNEFGQKERRRARANANDPDALRAQLADLKQQRDSQRMIEQNAQEEAARARRDVRGMGRLERLIETNGGLTKSARETEIGLNEQTAEAARNRANDIDLIIEQIQQRLEFIGRERESSDMNAGGRAFNAAGGNVAAFNAREQAIIAEQQEAAAQQAEEQRVLAEQQAEVERQRHTEQQMRTQEATSSFEQFRNRLVEMRDAGAITGDQLNEFVTQAQLLRDQFKQGMFDADFFAESMRKLGDATRDATQANREAEEQKRHEALLRGDFAGAGLSLRDAVEQRLAQFRRSQFNQMADRTFESLFGLNRVMQPVISGFQRLDTSMKDFGTRMQSSLSGGGGQFGAIGAFFATPGGQVASLQNQISLLQQNLGLVDTYRQRRRILDDIAQLEQQITALQQPQAPTFGGTSGDIEFKDPAGPIINQNRFEFPNLTRMSNAEVRQIADQIEAEQQRRGRVL